MVSCLALLTVPTRAALVAILLPFGWGTPLGSHCSVGQICFDWFGLGGRRDEMYPRHKWSERCTRVTTRSSRASPHGTAGLYGHNIGMPSGWFCIPQSRPVTNGSYVYLYSIESSRPLYRSSKIVYKNDLIWHVSSEPLDMVLCVLWPMIIKGYQYSRTTENVIWNPLWLIIFASPPLRT